MSVLNSAVAHHDKSQRAEEDVNEPPAAGDTHTGGDVIGYYDAGDRMSAVWVGYWGLAF